MIKITPRLDSIYYKICLNYTNLYRRAEIKKRSLASSMKLLTAVDRWLFYPGDSPENQELKRYFFLFTIGVVPPVIGLTFLTYWLDVPVLQLYGWLLLLYYAISITAFLLIKTHVTLFYYFNATIVMGLTFYTITKQGGLLYSGGIEYSNLAILVFAFVFYSRRLALITTFLYISGILIVALFQAHWKIAPEMTRGSVNLVFTTLNSIWISFYILMVIVYIFHKRTKDEHEKLEQMKEIDEMKSRLFTNITHEFRTPLTLISGAAELSSASASQLSHEKRYEIISQNAKRLLRLVNQMLGLAKIESGLIELHYEQADMMATLAYLLDSTKSMADKKSIKLHFIGKQDKVTMDIDKEKWEDIVLNLIYNAIKFTHPGGDVYLIAESISNHTIFELEVRDTGIGIPKEKIPLIFDRFYQANDKTQVFYEGSGIGLTLVKEYLKVLNGTIDVKSTVGSGTSFIVHLPIRQTATMASKQETRHPTYLMPDEPEAAPTPDENVGEPKTNVPHVLVVEDNVELARFLKAILSPLYRVDSASNGEEGITIATLEVPDLIISDVMMPIKDGYELCSALKSDFRTNHIPIILLTARADSEAKISGFQKGADAYIYKPFKEKELLVRIQKLIELREKLKIKYSNSILPGLDTADHNQQPHGLNERFMQDLTQILDKNYSDENFGIQDLCENMKISRVQLHRKLTALTGMSTSHFVNRFRVEKASIALLQTRKSVAEIAYEAGFSDPAYFSRVFNKVFGKTPVEFRG